MFAVDTDDDEKKVAGKKTLTGTITRDEIEVVVRKHMDGEKPSDFQLRDKIEDLEFELDCYKVNNKDVEKRIKALRLLLSAFDMKRFTQQEDKAYLTNYFQKVKHLIS